MSYKYIKKIRLNPSRHKSTGKTRHFVRGEQVENLIDSLKIVQCPPDEGFFLLYFNAQGKELTDTYHETLNDAMEQANWEFGVGSIDWENENN